MVGCLMLPNLIILSLIISSSTINKNDRMTIKILQFFLNLNQKHFSFLRNFYSSNDPNSFDSVTTMVFTLTICLFINLHFDTWPTNYSTFIFNIRINYFFALFYLSINSIIASSSKIQAKFLLKHCYLFGNLFSNIHKQVCVLFHQLFSFIHYMLHTFFFPHRH